MRKRSSFNLKELDLDPVSSCLFWCAKQLQTAQTHSGLFLLVLNKDKPHWWQFFLNNLFVIKHMKSFTYKILNMTLSVSRRFKGPLNVLRVLCGFTLTGWLIYLSSGVGGGGFLLRSQTASCDLLDDINSVFLFSICLPAWWRARHKRMRARGGWGKKMDGSPFGSFVSTFSSFQRGRSPVWFL